MDEIQSEVGREDKTIYTHLYESEKNLNKIISKLNEIYSILEIVTYDGYPEKNPDKECEKAMEPVTIKGIASNINLSSIYAIEKANYICRLIKREFQEKNDPVNKS